MKKSKSVNQFKRDITRRHIKYDNPTLIKMLEDGKKDEVVNSLLPMVIWVVNKFTNHREFEELISIGNEGLLKGLNKFNPERSDNIISYIQSSIKWNILTYLEGNNGIIKGSSYRKSKQFEIINIEDSDYLSSTDEEYKEVQLNRKELEELLLTIPKMKYSKVELFLDYYLIPGMTYQKVSDKLGFTKQNASLIILDILGKIKNNPQLKEKFREILLP